MPMTYDLPKILQENQQLIMDWARSLTHQQMRSHDFGGWKNGVLRNPLATRHDLFPPAIHKLLVNDRIRQIVYIDVNPWSEVPAHRHRETSFYRMDARGKMIDFPVDRMYKTTHFVIDAPKDRENVWMFIQGQKHYWEAGVFEVFDVIDNEHYAVNNTPEHLRILYFDYYPED